MYPILFSIGRINVYTHGLLIAVGAAIGGVLIYSLAKKENLKTALIFDMIVYSLLAGLVGSRLLYVILYHDQFASVKEMFFIWYGGLVSYGGIIGGILAAALFIKIKKESVSRWFDIGIMGLLVGWAFGRVGCLLAGDSLGIASDAKIAIWGRIPTQLFESVWVLLSAVICYLVYRNKNKWSLPNGIVFFFGVALYSLGRFLIDFFRAEEKVFTFLKAGQIGSIVIFTLAIIFGYWLYKKKDLTQQ